jgi:ribosomal protein L11 methyltransferase
MNYYVFDITPLPDSFGAGQYSTENNEILTVFLGELPFETFEDTVTGLKAYIQEKELTDKVEKKLSRLAKKHGFNFNKTFIAYQNWNVLWEANFEPIRVDDFVGLRADFHPPTEGVQFDLVINPKMAFGTGHHETTYMMMQLMREIDFKGKKVLDYGCGTGILAILASKLEAKTIEAVDIEYPAYENTIENCAINKVDNVKAIFGQLQDVESSDFDIILANINRNVILDSLDSLKNRLNTEGGVILISGFLIEDENVLLEALNKYNFTVKNKLHKRIWLCMLLE